MLASLTRSCLLIGLGAFVLFFMISVWFARWAVRPVETAWEDQKQFIADASHELKTPLTIILTNAQLLRSPDFDDAQKQRFSENILETATRMRTLVEGLLDLSRADTIVRAHHGEIYVRGKDMHNTFFVRLPVYNGDF